jgi:hypothetical protein
MKDFLIRIVIKAQLPKIIRHLLTIVGAWLAARGFEGANTENLIELITGSLTIGFSVVWSFLTKTQPGEGAKQLITAVVGAIARQAQTALAALLAIDPNQLSNGEVSTTAVIMVGINLLISRIDASDAKPK